MRADEREGLEQERAALARIVERGRAEQGRRPGALHRAGVVGGHDAAGDDDRVGERVAAQGLGAGLRKRAHGRRARDCGAQHLKPVAAADEVLAVEHAVDRERVARAAEALRDLALQPSTG